MSDAAGVREEADTDPRVRSEDAEGTENAGDPTGVEDGSGAAKEEEDEDGPDPVGEPAYRPAPIAAAAAVVGAVAAVVAAAVASVAGAAVASVGLVVLVASVVGGRRRGATIGAGVCFLGVLLAGVEGAPVLPVLFGTVGAAIAYDGGRYAIGLGEQVRAGASTRRAALLHAGAALAVASAAAGVGFLGFVLGSGGQPVSALVALLLGAVFLMLALR